MPFATVHQVMLVPPPEVGQEALMVSVFVAETPVGEAFQEQWTSLRSLSSPSRASVCAWNLRFMSTSAFVPETINVVIAPITVIKIVMLTSNSSEREPAFARGQRAHSP